MSNDALLRTALASVHERLGATMTDFAGWWMPLRYTSDREEHAAVRERAGQFDLSHMGQIQVEGPDAGAALDNALVTTPSSMPVGRARYSLLVDEDGGILDDLIVYRLDENDYLVIANASNRERVVDELTVRSEAASLQSLSVIDHTLSRALVAVQGPASLDIVTSVADDSSKDAVSELGYYRHTNITVSGIPVLLARTGYTGERGYELICPADSAAQLWEVVRVAGESYGLVPCGLAARDTLRLEAGMPLYGHELSREITPREAGQGRVVKLDHEFVGRDALAEREAEPRFSLYGLTGEGRRAARAGSTVSVDGEQVGSITSGVLSPTLGFPIALALLRPGLAPGTVVNVDVRGKNQDMTIAELPFYSSAH